MICSSCRSPNTLDARFCNNCGATLTGSNSTFDADTLVTTTEATAEAQTPQNDPLIGRTIEGKYRIDSSIGAGGMGAVYRSTRLLIGDEVAIKILHAERVVDPHASERFRREAQAAARLKHPNAVSIYDFGVSSDGLQYLVMELIEGKSLREVTRQQGPLDASLAAEVTSQVCAALDDAHRQHIVHRDIKPDNIILNSSAAGLRVKVLDFGIAKLRDDTASHLTQTGSVMGTPHYMSPEQCLGEELDDRADIYSVGVVLFEMLCGRVPFNAPISTAVVVQHVNQPPPPLRTINPSISSQMEAAVLHALEKRREARPQTAIAFAREVTAAVSGSAVDYEKQWTGGVPQPLVDKSTDDERTVEKRLPLSAFDSPKSAKEMAPTVHLASLSGSTGPVTPGRAKAGSGAVTPTRRRVVARKYAVVALSIVFLVTLIGFVSWRVFLGPEVNSPSKPGSDNANVVSDNANRGKTREDPTPPQGMAFVRGGTFMMGSNEGDQDSKPPHSVTVKPFFIDIYEATCEDYKKFVDDKGHQAPQAWSNGSYPSGAARQPVTGVSWEDADAYARWAGKRLPTEEEWEFAARGQNGLRYPWGNSWKPGCANADEEGQARKRMADVGSHNCGSPSGAMDMIGNAWEWTASDWVPYPGGHLEYPTKGGEKVIRGGSWESSQQYATSIYRSGLTRSGEKTGYDKTGFRCAKDTLP
jgi:serine/threonine protein kinase